MIEKRQLCLANVAVEVMGSFSRLSVDIADTWDSHHPTDNVLSYKYTR
jgi:hypothetical protein